MCMKPLKGPNSRESWGPRKQIIIDRGRPKVVVWCGCKKFEFTGPFISSSGLNKVRKIDQCKLACGFHLTIRVSYCVKCKMWIQKIVSSIFAFSSFLVSVLLLHYILSTYVVKSQAHALVLLETFSFLFPLILGKKGIIHSYSNIPNIIQHCASLSFFLISPSLVSLCRRSIWISEIIPSDSDLSNHLCLHPPAATTFIVSPAFTSFELLKRDVFFGLQFIYSVLDRCFDREKYQLMHQLLSVNQLWWYMWLLLDDIKGLILHVLFNLFKLYVVLKCDLPQK